MTRLSPQRRPGVGTRLAAVAASALMLAALFASAQVAQAVAAAPHAGPVVCTTSPCDIGDPTGPLTHVLVGPDLSCQVKEGATQEYTDCGTFVAVNGTLYGPPVSGGGLTPNAYSEDGQTITGDGTLQDPRQVTTLVHVGKLHITEIDTYAAGLGTYKTRITLENSGTAALPNVRLYRAADCELGGDTDGFGALEATTATAGHPAQLVSIGCASGHAPGSPVESWVSNSVNAHYFEGSPANLWSVLGAKADLPDTCVCPASAADNAAGISWLLTVGAGASIVRGEQTNFATNGASPLSAVVKADNSGRTVPVLSRGLDGYTVTINNPTTSPAEILSITDDLLPNGPDGFTYVAGSTTGDLGTDDPAIGPPGTLTWSTETSIPARGDLSLHFKAKAPTTGGVRYENAASATASAQDVAPTGPSAVIHVTQAYDLTLHKAGTGSGTVTGTPGHIGCGPSCSGVVQPYVAGPTVTLTATKSLGSRFTGWSGDCSGGGVCTVAMDADHDVTAQFDRVCTDIAYVSGKDIMTVPAGGGAPTVLVHSATGANDQPAWSPNCSKLAFTSTRKGVAQIFVRSTSGTTTQVTSGLRPSFQASWNATGSRIAFASTRSGKAQIFTAPATGGPATRVTKDTAADTQPDWAPVGGRIVFTGTSSGRPQLYSIRSDGTGLVRLTNTVGTNSQAAWSPTGARLLFISTRGGNPDVYVMNANGSRPIRLTASKTAVKSHPTWNPTGNYFAFASNGPGNIDVFTRTLAGAQLTDLTSGDPAANPSPAWSS